MVTIKRMNDANKYDDAPYYLIERAVFEDNITKADQTRTEMNECSAKCLGNVLKNVLNISIFPVVKAAKQEQQGPPEKPPPVRYTELSMYDNPYMEYKEHHEFLCDTNIKLLHYGVYPYVKKYRSKIQQHLADMKIILNDAINTVDEQRITFLQTMRSEDNLLIRQVVFCGGTAAGLSFGVRKYYIMRNLFNGTVSTLFFGWLCFPSETDFHLRNICWQISQAMIPILNMTPGCGDYRLDGKCYTMKDLSSLRPADGKNEPTITKCDPNYKPKGDGSWKKYSLVGLAGLAGLAAAATLK